MYYSHNQRRPSEAIKHSIVLVAALLAAFALMPHAYAEGATDILLENAQGWSQNAWEDENVSIMFAMANLTTYIRITNKTDKVMRFSWPAIGFHLPDGTYRTLCNMFDRTVRDGFELVPMTKEESEQAQLTHNLRPGSIITNKVTGKFKTKLFPSSDDLFIPAGCAIFCQLGFNVNEFFGSGAVETGALPKEGLQLRKVAEAEFFTIISGYEKGSIFVWALNYDFAGTQHKHEIRMKLQ